MLDEPFANLDVTSKKAITRMRTSCIVLLSRYKAALTA